MRCNKRQSHKIISTIEACAEQDVERYARDMIEGLRLMAQAAGSARLDQNLRKALAQLSKPVRH